MNKYKSTGRYISFLRNYKQLFVTAIVISVLFIILSSRENDYILEEIYEVSEKTSFFTLENIVFIILYLILGCGLYYLSHKIKNVSKTGYIRLRNSLILIFILVGLIVPIGILQYFDMKKDSLMQDAFRNLNDIMVNTHNIIDLNYLEHLTPELYEISPVNKDLKRSNSEIEIGLKYPGAISKIPYQNVLCCYDIIPRNNSYMKILFCSDFINKEVETESVPYLIAADIVPYRIYYKDSNINPVRDINNAYESLIKSLINTVGNTRKDGFLYTLMNRPLNEYYKLTYSLKNTSNVWRNNKIFNNEDNEYLRAYEYTKVSFGNYEITFCAIHTCRIEISLRNICSKVFGIIILDEPHIVQRIQVLVKWELFFIVAILSVYFILHYLPGYRYKS